jgi:DNA-binding transcriptional LysR family regulator
MTERTCRELGRFDPDIRHRTNDSVTSLALVRGGQAVTLLPALVEPDAGDRSGVAVRTIAEGSAHRTIFAATCTADAKRPSVQALLMAVRSAAAALGWVAPRHSRVRPAAGG